ncbi:hypothetical protein JCM24511_02029 [Saitozyma sp. JCM 24511]|nr:hypothetical protein JCM24511_02029 [Saitozyma sp. JCM 24511]
MSPTAKPIHDPTATVFSLSEGDESSAEMVQGKEPQETANTAIHLKTKRTRTVPGAPTGAG